MKSPVAFEDIVTELMAFEREAKSLEGWNLAYEPIQVEPGPPWNYEQRLSELLARASICLDIGTGGGEVLAKLIQDSQTTARVNAIEEYSVNAPVAAKTLQGLATVTRASGEVLPFENASFDAVFSRHTAIDPSEVARVLASDGRFVTQQVSPDFLCELQSYFEDFADYPNLFEIYCRGLKHAGLEVVVAQQFVTRSRFSSFGHLVYMLAVAPWLLADFSIDRYSKQLETLYDATDAGAQLEFTSGYFYIEAVQR